MFWICQLLYVGINAYICLSYLCCVTKNVLVEGWGRIINGFAIKMILAVEFFSSGKNQQNKIFLIYLPKRSTPYLKSILRLMLETSWYVCLRLWKVLWSSIMLCSINRSDERALCWEVQKYSLSIEVVHIICDRKVDGRQDRIHIV